MPFSSSDPNAFVALGKQTALGTPNVTAAQLRFSKYNTGTRYGVEPEVTFLREGGDGQNFGYAYKNKQVSRGQLVFNARPEFLGQLLSVALGGAAWDLASAPAKHTFHTSHASYPWSTLLSQFPGSSMAHLLADVRFAGVQIEWQTGQPLQVTAPFLSLTHSATLGAFTPSYDTREEPFLYHHAPSIVLSGASDLRMTKVTINHTFDLDELQAQLVTLDDAVVLAKDTTVEITRRYENATQWLAIAMGGGFTPTTSVPTSDLRVSQQYFSGGSVRRLDVRAPLVAWETADIGELDPNGQTIYEVYSGKALQGATSALIAYLEGVHASTY
jgi:Phage tail tube protein